MNKNLSKYWLYLGFIALGISGIFAIFLVIGRSPYIYTIIPHKDFFKSSLTIHVNLSVLIWLLSCYASIASLSLKRFFIINKIGLIFASIATIVISLSIFDFESKAFTNNYVPFTNSLVFQSAIYLFFTGILLVCFSCLIGGDFKKESYLTSASASLIIIFSSICFAKTYFDLSSCEYKNMFFEADFYEKLFWPAGHILMFVYSAILIYAWFTIAKSLSPQGSIKFNQGLKICQIINLTCALVGVPICFLNKPETFEFTDLYTKHMIYFGGIAPTIAAIILFKEYLNIFNTKGIDRFIGYNFFWSYVLFLSGGFIAMLIEGANTKIPAHYHGSIIGISMALMGLSFVFLKIYGFSLQENIYAKLQAHFYGAGQLVHIIGLAISGGYGALRKTPGMMESAEGRFYMGLMGLGGLFAIIGGLCFVIAVIKITKTKINQN